MSLETIKEDMQFNFFTMVNIVKEIISKMYQGSSIVFFGIVAAGTDMYFYTGLAMAKGATEGFARLMAAEYAPRIRVNMTGQIIGIDGGLSTLNVN